MRIGELSKKTGVSVRMLRYYEAQGLLNPPRTPSGYRSYGMNDVDTVDRILTLNNVGIPLASVSGLLTCVRSKPDKHPPCDALKAKVIEHLAKIEGQLAALEATKKVLSEMIEA